MTMDRSFTEALASGGCILAGEVAMAHDGSLGLAHAFIDAIARAGARAVKFQTHLAASEGTAAEPFRVAFSPQAAPRRDYWPRPAFPEEQGAGLARHADERGLFFLSSPFSPEAVDLLRRIGVAAWKVPSGETGNLPLLEAMLEDGLPVLLSTGMSPMAEIDAAAARVRDSGVPWSSCSAPARIPAPPTRWG